MPLGGDNGGPFKVTLTAAAPAAAGRMTLQVSGEPAPALMNAAVGDYFQFPGSSADLVRIVQKNSATEWVVDRTVPGQSPAAQPAGASLTAFCTADVGAPATPSIYWNFLEDPRATDMSGKSVAVEKVLSGNHMVQRGNYRLQEWWLDGFQIVTPGAPKSWNAPVTYKIPSNPKWAGRRVWLGLSEPAAGLEGYQTHPSYENYLAEGEGRNNWFVDVIPFVGSNKIHGGVSLAAGRTRVYKVNGARLNRDAFPTFALCGGRQLKDISPGPITDQSAYSYCVGSGCADSASNTDVFVSCPAPVSPASRCNENFYGDDSAVCVSDLAPYGQSVAQFFFDPSGARNRVLTNGLFSWHSPRTFMTLDTPSPIQYFGEGVVRHGIYPRRGNYR